jgi:hypothetical protein
MRYTAQHDVIQVTAWVEDLPHRLRSSNRMSLLWHLRAGGGPGCFGAWLDSRLRGNDILAALPYFIVLETLKEIP